MKKYGWIPDRPDFRDLKLAPPAVAVAQPSDLRSGMPPVYDQGQLGSCTANAIAAAFDYERKRQGLPFITPSRLFLYYGERLLEGTVHSDSGASLRDGMKVCAKTGLPPEKDWPYVVSKYAIKPTPKSYLDASKDLALVYKSVTRSAVAATLASGLPVVFGFTVYESFQNIGSDGIMPFPKASESVLGGHAVVAVGYELIGQKPYYVIRNSWGGKWGDHGYFYMPGSVITLPGMSTDFWTIQQVELC